MKDQIRAFVHDFEEDVQIHFRQTDFSGKKYTVKIIENEEIKTGRAAEPLARISPTDAQVLMDDLWSCGLRPTEGKGSAGALSATQNHLNDMRKIVFKKIGIDNA